VFFDCVEFLLLFLFVFFLIIFRCKFFSLKRKDLLKMISLPSF